MASAKQLFAARSWSIEYLGDAVDDARNVGGVWYRRDIITRKFVRLECPRKIVLLFENAGVSMLPATQRVVRMEAS